MNNPFRPDRRGQLMAVSSMVFTLRVPVVSIKVATPVDFSSFSSVSLADRIASAEKSPAGSLTSEGVPTISGGEFLPGASCEVATGFSTRNEARRAIAPPAGRDRGHGEFAVRIIELRA